MSDNPIKPGPAVEIKLWPGPVVDGRETYFALGRDIPAGWQRRSYLSSWSDDSRSSPARWYQVRPPVPTPDPDRHYWRDGDEWIVDWAVMKDRPDLDRWEKRSVEKVGWAPLDVTVRSWWPDDYPLRIRRRKEQR